jgi:hypothetical protein
VNLHTVRIVANALSSAAALGASALWFLSAREKLPQNATVRYDGKGGDLALVLDALRRQSNLSAWASGMACVAALTQAVAMVLGP